jgi:hypothetical protein
MELLVELLVWYMVPDLGTLLRRIKARGNQPP